MFYGILLLFYIVLYLYITWQPGISDILQPQKKFLAVPIMLTDRRLCSQQQHIIRVIVSKLHYFTFIEVKQHLPIFGPVKQLSEVSSQFCTINIRTNFTEKFSIVCKLKYIATYSVLNVIYKWSSLFVPNPDEYNFFYSSGTNKTNKIMFFRILFNSVLASSIV